MSSELPHYRWRVFGGNKVGWYVTRHSTDEYGIWELNPEAIPAFAALSVAPPDYTAPPAPSRSHEEVMLAIRAAHPETIERDFEAQCRVSILLREHGPSRFNAEQIVAAEWHVRQALEAALQGPVRLFNAVRSVEVARDQAMSHLSLRERPLVPAFVGAYRRATDSGRALLGGGRDFWFQVATAPVLYSLRAPVQREPEEPTPPAAPATMQQAALF